MKCECVCASVDRHTRLCENLTESEEKGEPPEPLELSKSVTYNSSSNVITTGVGGNGDFYESTIESAKDAKNLGQWLIGWSRWKENEERK